MNESKAQVREGIRGAGLQWELTNLPFNDEEKEIIVEYLASRLYKLLHAMGVEDGGGWKWYDPLKIEGNVALSYVFDFEEGGRRHAFRDLSHLEQMLIAECATSIKEHFSPDSPGKS